VTVRGDAIIRAEPDEAVLWVTLSALKNSPGPALSDVSGRSNALVALLDKLGVAKGDRSRPGSPSTETSNTHETDAGCSDIARSRAYLSA
jgi:hypothetical protein